MDNFTGEREKEWEWEMEKGEKREKRVLIKERNRQKINEYILTWQATSGALSVSIYWKDQDQLIMCNHPLWTVKFKNRIMNEQ